MWTLCCKLAGAAALVVCGAMAGSLCAGALARRRRFYAELVLLCERLLDNARYLREPLPAFFARLAGDESLALLAVDFDPRRQSFADWRAAFGARLCALVPLPEAERQALRDFWQSLGEGGTPQEGERLEYCRRRFAAAGEAAAQMEKERARLCRSLGICGGAAAAILLL